MDRTVKVSYGVVALLSLVTASCTSVDILRLTGQTFPAKSSPAEVTLLEREPTCPHLRLAELHIDDSTVSFETMQRKILERAASLGADAVLFEKPEKHIQHQVTYEPAYSPWGYGAYGYPGWGYGGAWYGYGPYGYGGGMAVPYDYTVRSLKATAIRYTSRTGPCAG